MMQTGTVKTADGLTLHTFESHPTGKPRGVVYLVHGIAEHTGRYGHVVAFLNERGYSVYGHDHRGHGRSQGERVYFETFDTPVADLKVLVDAARAKHAGVPFFVYGHSMGALISTLFVQRYPEGIAGFISTGSPLAVTETVPKPVQAILRGLARIVPKLPALPVDSSTISQDPAVVADYDSDPLNVRARTKVGMAVAFSNGVEQARAGLGRVQMPLLIIHGEADRMTPLSGSRLLHEKAGSKDKHISIYPTGYHEVHNEPFKETVLTEIADWLDAHTA